MEQASDPVRKCSVTALMKRVKENLRGTGTHQCYSEGTKIQLFLLGRFDRKSPSLSSPLLSLVFHLSVPKLVVVGLSGVCCVSDCETCVLCVYQRALL